MEILSLTRQSRRNQQSLGRQRPDQIIPASDVNEHIVRRRFRPIAGSRKKPGRPAGFPTISEQGINMAIIANARAFLAPPGVSKDVVGYWENFFAG